MWFPMKAILTMIRCIRIRHGSSSSFPYNTPRDFSPRIREFLYTQRLPTRPAIYHGLVCGSASHPLIEWVHIPSSGLRTPGVPEKTLGTFSELRHARDDASTNKSIVMPDPHFASLWMGSHPVQRTADARRVMNRLPVHSLSSTMRETTRRQTSQ